MSDSDFNRIRLPPSVKSSVLADLSNNFTNGSQADVIDPSTQQTEEPRGRSTLASIGDPADRPVLRNAGVATAPIIPTLKSDSTKGQSTGEEEDGVSPMTSHEGGVLQPEPRPGRMQRLASMVEESDCDSDCGIDEKAERLYCKKHKKVHAAKRIGEKLKRRLSKEPTM